MPREIIATYVPLSSEEQGLQFSASMTQNQFEALECKLDQSLIIEQLRNLRYLDEIRLSSMWNINVVEKWLKNSWNTENLLRITSQSFEGNSLLFAIQWAFPQMYYSAFSSILAYFNVVGFTENSHSKVKNKCGFLINEEKYPPAMSFRSIGGKYVIRWHGITYTRGHPSIWFVRSMPESIDNQISQFLKTTREGELEYLKTKTKIKKADGSGNKKNFNQEDWESISSNLGYTNIISLLYRMRIKSNYQEIDTFLSQHLNPVILFNSLIKIINSINLVHETFISKCINKTRFNRLVEGATFDFVNSRYEIIDEIIS